MTAEDIAAMLKGANITVNGDFVASKHVEYEIGNVEQGGIGIQINGNAKSTSTTKTTGGNKSETKLVQTTFVYKYKDTDERIRVIKFYQQLLKAQLIEASTMPEPFLEIFSGKASDAKVKWLGKKSFLYYLVKKMIDRKLIKCASGDDHWIITQSHFIDEKNHVFVNLHKEKDPKKAMLALNKLVDILDPSVPDEDE